MLLDSTRFVLRILSFSLAFIIVVPVPSALAQITLGQDFINGLLTSEYTVTAYEPIAYLDVEAMTVPQAGGVFDFRGVNMQRRYEGGVSGVQLPANIPGADDESFSSATHGVLTHIDEAGWPGTTSTFYRLDSDELHVIGVYTESVDDLGDKITSKMIYEPAGWVQPIPTTVTSSWAESVTETLYINEVQFSTASLDVSYDVIGYGTLMTDFGSTEVLQFRRTERRSMFGFTVESEEYELIGRDSIVARVPVEEGEVGTLEIDVSSGFRGTSAEDLQTHVKRLEVSPNHPNPFSESTTIAYEVPTTQHVSVTVYDMLGREVSTLVDHVVSAGSHRAVFNATGHPSGIYLYRIVTGDQTHTGQMILAR